MNHCNFGNIYTRALLKIQNVWTSIGYHNFILITGDTFNLEIT